MRAKALLDDDFRPSDMAWMEMKTNPVDIVIGPIETYEDQLFGYKAAYEGLVLIKDVEWSQKLARFASFLPALQKGLPVRGEVQGRESRAPTPTSMPTRSSTTAATPTSAPRPSPSTCPTTKKCSWPRARAGCSWRT